MKTQVALHQSPLTLNYHVVTTLLIKEPDLSGHNKAYSTTDYLRFFALFLVIICLFFILRVEVFDKQFCFLFTYNSDILPKEAPL
jgi:hypothetical protein